MPKQMHETNIVGSEGKQYVYSWSKQVFIVFFWKCFNKINYDQDFLYNWVWCYMKIGGCMNVGKIIMWPWKAKWALTENPSKGKNA